MLELVGVLAINDHLQKANKLYFAGKLVGAESFAIDKNGKKKQQLTCNYSLHVYMFTAYMLQLTCYSLQLTCFSYIIMILCTCLYTMLGDDL